GGGTRPGARCVAAGILRTHQHFPTTGHRASKRAFPGRAWERGSCPALLTAALLVRLQDGQERLLRDLDLADLLHALLARRLLGPQLALARDVAAVALGGHVLLDRGDRLAGDDAAADGRLDGDLEQVAVDLAAQLLHQLA